MGRPATRVDVGYFVDGSFGISSGTRASAAGVMLAPGFGRANGALTSRRPGSGGTRSFDLGRGRVWKGMAVAGSEHLTLPLTDDSLSDVGVWLGWAGKWTTPASLAGGAAFFRSTPRSTEVEMVAPDREIPGRIAIACEMPIDRKSVV